MNSKAIRKQLLAAVAMVLVAAVALGSSTYAWFVASGTVTATDVRVQAQSEGGLAIRWTGEESELWGTTASAKMTTAESAAKLLPTSTYDLKHWSYAKASKASASTAEDGTYENVSKSVLGEQLDGYIANNYVLMQPFEIRSTAKDRPAKGLFVSNVTVTRTDSKDLDSALRVGVRLLPKTDSAAEVFFIYAPVANATTTYNWTDGTTTQAVTLAEYGTKTNNKSTVVASSTEIPFAEGDAVDVEIYVWYEGEDAKLFSDNYVVNTLNVSVQFSSYDFKAA